MAEGTAEAFERLQHHHFAEPVHQRVWSVMAGQQRAGLIDIVAVHGTLKDDPAYTAMGGMPWLADMLDQAPTWALESHVGMVLDRAARRSIVRLCEHTIKVCRDTSTGDPDLILGDIEHAAAEIAREGATKPKAVPVGLTALEMVEAAWRGDFIGASVGLECLDKVTGGIGQDHVWFIGARTSMGKSAFALSLARGIAEQGRGVMAFSLEMPLREVQARLIADIAYSNEVRYDAASGGNVRYSDILRGKGTPQQQARAVHAARALASLPISVTDEGGLTIEDIRVQAQRQMRAWDKAGVPRGAVLIDHIGLVKPHRHSDSKAAETADTVNELKSLAKYLKAPIIALCQVNRNTENRNDKRPTLADLNWSGAIEQIADMICLLYRDAYYLERSSDETDQTEAVRKQYDLDLLIHKNRSGPICTLNAFVDIACNAVRDKDDPYRRVA